MKKSNEDLTRKEENTKAPTPDKMDRSSRGKNQNPLSGKKKNPYPLTEEEATPNIPKSQQE
jgi:hypothetical protein